MINVSNEVKIYEVDGKEEVPSGFEKLWIKSHWNNDRLIIIQLPGASVTVARKDLDSAITNATNTAR